MLIYKHFEFVFMIFLFLHACGEPEHEIKEEDVSVHVKENMMEDTIVLAEDTSIIIRCNGRIEVPPQFKADIYARTSGYIETLHVLRGEKVEIGALLATIADQSILQLQLDYLNAELEVDKLEKVYERHRSLFEENAVSEKELEQSLANYEQEFTRFQSLKASLQFVGIPIPTSREAPSASIAIRAPIKGFVNRVDANNGKRIQANQPLFQIIDDSHKHIELEVFPNQADRLALGQRVLLRPSGGEQDAEGYVYLINSAVDEVKQTINVHVHLTEDREDLRVSSYVEARILTDQIISDRPENGY